MWKFHRRHSVTPRKIYNWRNRWTNQGFFHCCSMAQNIDWRFYEWWFCLFHSNEVSSKLSISFKQPYLIALNRSEAYTLVDFIARYTCHSFVTYTLVDSYSSCGGLFGLYMGISVLSVFELIYYFTLRLCCTMRQRQSIQDNSSTWAKRNQLPLVNRQPKRKRY